MNIQRRTAALVLIVALTGGTAVTVTGCAETSTHESTGQYVDDSAITSKVKAKLLNDSVTHGLQIDVDTYKGAVQLSGFVDSAQEKARAEELAHSVDGVKSVDNALKVKNQQ